MLFNGNLRPKRLDLRPKRLDLRPKRLDLRLERWDLRPVRLDLRPEGSDEGGTHARTNERTNKSPPVFYRTLSLFGATALLPFTPIYNHTKLSNGYC